MPESLKNYVRAISLCMAFTVAAFAQPTTRPAPRLPILEPTTYMVMRLDLTTVDIAALSTSIQNLVSKTIVDPAQRQQLRTMLNPLLAQLHEIRRAMIEAGAPVVYISFSDFPPASPMIYAPLAPGGKAEAVRSVLYAGKPKGSMGPGLANAQPLQTVTVAMAEGVFAGRAQDYQRISQPHAGAPQLVFALSNAPDAMLQIVAAPSETASPALEAIQPQFPPPVDMPMTVLTQGVGSIVGTIQGPPEPSMRIVIQATDAASANQLKLMCERLFSMLATPQIQRQVPPEFDLPALATALVPQLQGDQLIIAPDRAQSERLMLAPLLLPAMAKTRQAAQGAQPPPVAK